MKIDIVTIFPDFFSGPLDYGIVRRAREAGLVEIVIHDLRGFTNDRHKTVDDRPFGGGEGMVLKPEPLFACVESLGLASRGGQREDAEQTVVLLSAQGEPFDQSVAAHLATLERMVFICGRYEGVDERVATQLADRELSIGDYVLSGGELGAAVILDAVVRLLPGALGNDASAQRESFTAGIEPATQPGPSSTCLSGGLLDYPHYTRPARFREFEVPEVLFSGNHEDIRRWRRRAALEKTLRNRPDLLASVPLSPEDKKLLAEIQSQTIPRKE
jgi:tRNA (guanine37-N1)-methyltransferase